jgi:hypothetical protein
MRETGADMPVTYSSTDGPEEKAAEICDRLEAVLSESTSRAIPAVALEKYSTATMTSYLAACFTRATAS